MNHHNHLQSYSYCQECGSSQSNCWILHNLRLKASIRRLCTNCVLKNNRSLFCPVCFDFYDSYPPPSNQRVICFKCPSISHLSCVSFPLPPTFLCPLCSDPRFSFFDSVESETKSAFSVSEKSTKAIVVAARVAAQSMKKAAEDARVDAERKIKVAVYAKKQARLALERLAYLELKQMETEKEKDRFTRSDEDAVEDARPIAMI